VAFQFHYGSVKSLVFRAVQQRNLYFNSTMVRLKVRVPNRKLTTKEYFNSTMVRLKATIPSACTPSTSISIPLWFG